MIRVFEIGDIVGKNNALLVTDFIKKGEDGSKESLYRVQCLICKEDPELFGEAIYERSSDFIKSGKLPCGCSKTTKWTTEQWEVLAKRRCDEINSEFNGFVDAVKVGQNTKVKIRCNACNNDWQSCSLNNLLKGRRCPFCANKKRSINKLTSETEWIGRFRKTGMFPEQIYSFARCSETSREFEVVCRNCGEDKVFISDRSNLVAGKIPCDCNNGGGFDVNKQGYFYILHVANSESEFIKFGITNFPIRRFVDHARTLKCMNYEITGKRLYTASGAEVLRVESKLKRELETQNQLFNGFRSETCRVENLQKIEQELTNMTEVFDF